MKGVDIVVKGSVGHMSAFMAQSGTLVVPGDAGEALGDSLQETGWKIVRYRLPRLLTDQTATVARTETADAVPILLPLLRMM